MTAVFIVLMACLLACYVMWDKRHRTFIDYRCYACHDTGLVWVLVDEDSPEREPCDACDAFENRLAAQATVEDW